MPKDPRVSVGVAVIVQRVDGYLLIERKGSHAAGCWSFPGGWLDYGEEPADAALRELKEEVGLTNVRLRERQPIYVVNNIFPQESLQSVTLYFEAVDPVRSTDIGTRPPNELVADLIVPATPTIQEPQNLEPDKIGRMGWFKRGALPTPLFPGIAEAIEHHWSVEG